MRINLEHEAGALTARLKCSVKQVTFLQRTSNFTEKSLKFKQYFIKRMTDRLNKLLILYVQKIVSTFNFSFSDFFGRRPPTVLYSMDVGHL
jgi:hypothetical protein